MIFSGVFHSILAVSATVGGVARARSCWSVLDGVGVVLEWCCSSTSPACSSVVLTPAPASTLHPVPSSRCALFTPEFASALRLFLALPPALPATMASRTYILAAALALPATMADLAFVPISSGSNCAAHGCTPVNSAAECAGAASFVDAEYHGTKSWGNGPPGCYCYADCTSYRFNFDGHGRCGDYNTGRERRLRGKDLADALGSATRAEDGSIAAEATENHTGPRCGR